MAVVVVVAAAATMTPEANDETMWGANGTEELKVEISMAFPHFAQAKQTALHLCHFDKTWRIGNKEITIKAYFLFFALKSSRSKRTQNEEVKRMCFLRFNIFALDGLDYYVRRNVFTLFSGITKALFPINNGKWIWVGCERGDFHNLIVDNVTHTYTDTRSKNERLSKGKNEQQKKETPRPKHPSHSKGKAIQMALLDCSVLLKWFCHCLEFAIRFRIAKCVCNREYIIYTQIEGRRRRKRVEMKHKPVNELNERIEVSWRNAKIHL